MPGFRMLSREELIEAIEERGGRRCGRPHRNAAADAPRASRHEGAGAAAGGAAPAATGEREREPAEDEAAAKEPTRMPGTSLRTSAEVETEEVTGVLDRMPQGYGFLRLEGLSAHEGDVYVSASQIRRCELRPGDEVRGPARSPRRGERHRALVRVESVNGQEPEGERVQFEDLTAVAPNRRLPLGEGEPLARAVDLLAPLAYGQRVLILAEPALGAEHAAALDSGARSPPATPGCGCCWPTSAPRR